MTPIPVSHWAVDMVFPKIADYLRPALEHNRISVWTLDGIYTECTSGRMTLFVDDIENPTACAVAMFQTWGMERVFYIAFMGGAGNTDWLTAAPYWKEFARKFGVTRVVSLVRPGLTRLLKTKTLAILCEIED